MVDEDQWRSLNIIRGALCGIDSLFCVGDNEHFDDALLLIVYQGDGF